MTVTKNNVGLGNFEPEVSRTFLPGCRNCGGSHPLARKPQLPADVCPDCKEPANKPGATITDRAALLGASGLLARTCFSISQKLQNLAKGI